MLLSPKLPILVNTNFSLDKDTAEYARGGEWRSKHWMLGAQPAERGEWVLDKVPAKPNELKRIMFAVQIR